MKPVANVKQRPRGRSNNSNNSGGMNKKHMPVRNQTFDSNGPDVRIRGNAHQVLEKYLTMARDSTSQGDRIAAENYYQHAEHYLRVINSQNHAMGRQTLRPLSSTQEDETNSEGELTHSGEDTENSDNDDFENDSEGNPSETPIASDMDSRYEQQTENRNHSRPRSHSRTYRPRNQDRYKQQSYDKEPVNTPNPSGSDHQSTET